ncbi:MAG: peptidylprolyl isomerase [Candidatus Methanofastidiosa archaeon]|jgi:peptidyl-prolyl cis-trans isomerase C|nr:peptidylprolyl isomerase [Candidatus Methanofastidiosa archaeon]
MVKQVHAAHILVKSEDLAKELHEKIKKGESFSDLAKKFSQCPSGKKGGDLGFFSRQKMVKEFEKAAFDGKEGTVVGPIKTQFGWHLIKIIEKK